MGTQLSVGHGQNRSMDPPLMGVSTGYSLGCKKLMGHISNLVIFGFHEFIAASPPLEVRVKCQSDQHGSYLHIYWNPPAQSHGHTLEYRVC